MINEKKLRLIAKERFDKHFKELFEKEELPKEVLYREFLRRCVLQRRERDV